MSDLTNKIDNLLMSRKMKRSDLFKALNIPQTSYSSWIKGTIPNAVITCKMAKYLGVSVEFLLGEDETPPAADLVFLSDDENEIIDIYRSLDKRGKETLLTMAKGLEGVK